MSPDPQVYLIFSSDARWVQQQRDKLLDGLMPREMRDENLLEIYSGQGPLRLEDHVSAIVSELATIPFLPDSRRVVVVHELADLLVAGGGKRKGSAAAKAEAAEAGAKKKGAKGTGAPERKRATPVEALAAFVKHDLPATPNVLVFSNVVEIERGQQIDEKSALFKLFAPPMGRAIRPTGRQTDPLWLMGDALLARDAPNCLRLFRTLYHDDVSVRFRIFGEILKNVRFLLQAKVLPTLRAKGVGDEAIRTSYLPEDKRLSLLLAPDFIQEKVRKAAPRFNVRELMKAMEDLLAINRVLIPSQSDTYAPDVKLLMETFLIALCVGAK
jgi:hypothetical protein